MYCLEQTTDVGKGIVLSNKHIVTSSCTPCPNRQRPPFSVQTPSLQHFFHTVNPNSDPGEHCRGINRIQENSLGIQQLLSHTHHTHSHHIQNIHIHTHTQSAKTCRSLVNGSEGNLISFIIWPLGWKKSLTTWIPENIDYGVTLMKSQTKQQKE